MKHYVYLSYEVEGRMYIGSRSSEDPEKDTNYFGSYADKTFKPTEKKILRLFPTREKALYYECQLHEHFAVDTNPKFANKSRQTTEKFYYSAPGDTNPAKCPEVRKKLSESKKGDRNPSKRPDVRKKLVEGVKKRPPISDETRAKMRESHLGQSSPRGMLGKKHSEETKKKMRESRRMRTK
ncbi:hypothetical protein Syn7803C10_283 [Synechococcus phage ACG-2014f]|uniref:Nuclease associated modular domain-containing protein n=1 Tax=Synechococcus phage ACG-2014f TaxID=1493511 RepID=A0A0E3I3B3_9CAUD|nr:hypothetical protein Syn7803C10_283 [Synechococcus phage ACG-2014f]